MQKDSRIIAAILAADVVEYSRLMAADEPGTLATLKARRALFGQLVSEFDGREFGSVGDSLMAEFHSAVNAVSAALALQERVAVENAALQPPRRMLLRVGVNLGDVIEEKGSVFGDAVNVAARLQALAKPGGVMISGAVYDQVHAKVAARYVDAGTRQVKNIREPVRTFEVLPAVPPGMVGRLTIALSGLASRRILRGDAGRRGDRHRARAWPLLAQDPYPGDRPHAGRALRARNRAGVAQLARRAAVPEHDG